MTGDTVMSKQVAKPKLAKFFIITNLVILGYYVVCALSDSMSNVVHSGFMWLLSEMQNAIGALPISQDNPLYQLSSFLAYFVTLVLTMGICVIGVRYAEHGSFKAMNEAANNAYKKLNQRKELGELKLARVERGGLLSSPTSTIETTKGIYRVEGDIGSVTKGEIVSSRADYLFLGVGIEKRKYRLIK